MQYYQLRILCALRKKIAENDTSLNGHQAVDRARARMTRLGSGSRELFVEGEMADLELKYAHLSNRDSPARKANREALREHIEEIQADLPFPRTPPSGPPIRVADRFAGVRPRGRWLRELAGELGYGPPPPTSLSGISVRVACAHGYDDDRRYR